MSELAPVVYLFHIGESYDDLHPAFFIDEGTYPDPSTAKSDLRAASAELDRLRIISEVEVAPRESLALGALPSWREFHQRHLVEGVPLPVASVPVNRSIPPGWEEMWTEMRRAASAITDELAGVLHQVLPDCPVRMSDGRPKRHGPGSVDLGNERYRFTVVAEALTRGRVQHNVNEQLLSVLKASGWSADKTEQHGSDLDTTAVRGDFSLWLSVEPKDLVIQVDSPLYRASSPDGGWVTEPYPSRA